MLRFRYVLASLPALVFLTSGACNNSIKDGDLTEAKRRYPPRPPTDGGGGGPCKPQSASCYLEGENGGPQGIGSECMAKRNNTGQDHIQLRQTWAVNTKPPGLANHPLIPATLSGATNFKSADCNTPEGASGYMLALDWDRSAAKITDQVSYIGYADRVADASEANALSAGGLCMTAFNYNAKGLNPSVVPPINWAVKPGLNHRVDKDFDVAKDIVQLRATVKEGEGIFYYDDTLHSVHGYSPVTWVVVNPFDAEAGMSVVPIRDAELRITANDENQNCVGRYRDDKLTADQCDLTDVKQPAWGCLYDTGDPDCDPSTGTCCDVGQSQARVLGHFKITDLEQVPNILGETVCVTYVGGAAEAQKSGYTGSDSHFCSSHPEWRKGTAGDPTRRGDWCDKENKAKDGTCVADSWLTETFMGLQAFPIQLDAQGTPKTCVPKFQQPLPG